MDSESFDTPDFVQRSRNGALRFPSQFAGNYCLPNTSLFNSASRASIRSTC